MKRNGPDIANPQNRSNARSGFSIEINDLGKGEAAAYSVLFCGMDMLLSVKQNCSGRSKTMTNRTLLHNCPLDIDSIGDPGVYNIMITSQS